MNERIMRGLATYVIPYLEEYIDAQIRSICVGIPPSVRYVGYERCTPEEEFEFVTKLKNNKRFFELAKTNKYMVKYSFEYTDELGKKEVMVKHIYLPYVTEGGLLKIAGTEMHLIPVLSDKVFTPKGDSIFVRLVQDRNNFYRMYHTIRINDVRVSRYVAHAEIYRSAPKKSSGDKFPMEQTTKAKTVLPHYLFARYGFTGAFERYIGHVPVVGNDKTITPENYSPEAWVICESTQIQPKKSNLDKLYRPTNIRLAIPKDKFSHEMECLVVGFFYVVDHFPERFVPNLSEIKVTPTDGVDTADAQIAAKYLEYLNDRALWMILIGHIRFSGLFVEQRLYNSIAEHFETIEPYLDQAVKTKLAENGIYLDNYFDLLFYIQAKFNDFILENERNGLCVYGKNLEILQYVAYDILYGFTMMKFKLNKTASRGEMITQRDVSEALRRIVKMGALFKLQNGDKLVCEVVGYSGDHLYPKITSVVAQQENRAGGGRTTEKRVVPGPDHWIDLSMVFAGSVLNLPKSNPTPVVRINPYITIDEKTSTVIPNEKFKPLVEKYGYLFKH